MLGIEERIPQLDIKVVVIDPVEEHIHTRQIVGRRIYFLPIKSPLYLPCLKEAASLQEKRTRATSGVIDLIYLRLPMDCKSCDELGDLWRGKELPTRLTRIGGIVRDQVLVGIAEEVNLTLLEGTEIQVCNPLHHRTEAAVLLLDACPQTGTRRVEVGKEPLEIGLGGIAHG